MRLPNYENAIIDIAKLRDYCLNINHKRGKHKAKVFTAALGLTQYDAELLRQAIFNAISESDAIALKKDIFGQRYAVDFEMSTSKGSALLRSGWIIRHGEDVPRLTTCFVR